MLRGDPQGVRKVWRQLISTFGQQTLLYVALARSGHPQRIVASRGLQAVLRRLLAYLPRLGLLRETVQLISTIQEMETNHPVGPGGDHRVRPDVQDRLPGDCPQPGGRQRRMGPSRARPRRATTAS